MEYTGIELIAKQLFDFCDIDECYEKEKGAEAPAFKGEYTKDTVIVPGSKTRVYRNNDES